MGKVERLLKSQDRQSRGAEVRVQGRGSSGGGLLVRRSLQLLYPMEVSCSTNEAAPREQVPGSPEQPTPVRARENRERVESGVEQQVVGERMRRQWIAELQDEN